MKCENCNKEIPANSTFCPECGQKQRTSVCKKYVCPTCGAPLEYNDLFCEECGTPCDPVPVDTLSRHSKSHSVQVIGRNILAETEFFKMVVATMFVILILALAMSFYFLYKKNETTMVSRDSSSTSQSNSIPSQPHETENTDKTDMSAPSNEDNTNDTEKLTEDYTNSDYILPQSTSRLLSSDDISELSLREINYAKNEIYARHGRMFHSSELQNYFNSKSWYHGTIDPDSFGESLLSDIEKRNAEFLATTEFSMNPNGYQLDIN